MALQQADDVFCCGRMRLRHLVGRDVVDGFEGFFRSANDGARRVVCVAFRVEAGIALQVVKLLGVSSYQGLATAPAHFLCHVALVVNGVAFTVVIPVKGGHPKLNELNGCIAIFCAYVAHGSIVVMRAMVVCADCNEALQFYRCEVLLANKQGLHLYREFARVTGEG